MLQVRAVECVGIQEDRHGIVERDAVFRRVGLGLPRVPLEHVFSIYGMLGKLGATDQGGRRPCHTSDPRSARRHRNALIDGETRSSRHADEREAGQGQVITFVVLPSNIACMCRSTESERIAWLAVSSGSLRVVR